MSPSSVEGGLCLPGCVGRGRWVERAAEGVWGGGKDGGWAAATGPPRRAHTPYPPPTRHPHDVGCTHASVWADVGGSGGGEGGRRGVGALASADSPFRGAPARADASAPCPPRPTASSSRRSRVWGGRAGGRGAGGARAALFPRAGGPEPEAKPPPLSLPRRTCVSAWTPPPGPQTRQGRAHGVCAGECGGCGGARTGRELWGDSEEKHARLSRSLLHSPSPRLCAPLPSPHLPMATLLARRMAQATTMAPRAAAAARRGASSEVRREGR